jgi:hypothetical protein
LKIKTTGVGYFETLLIFNDESVRGIYRISASYLEQVDKNMDITFEVIDKKLDSSSKSSSGPQILDSSQSQKKSEQNNKKIPEWVKNNARWWATEQIGDHAFVSGIQYLIEKNILQTPDLDETPSQIFRGMPVWVKNLAGYWAEGIIDDDEFINGIQYLVKSGIIKVS